MFTIQVRIFCYPIFTMAAKQLKIQTYPRDDDNRARSCLFERPDKPFTDPAISKAIEKAFLLCLKDKAGNPKKKPDSPEDLVKICVEHLKKRSDPILSSYFIAQLKAEQIFELDAVSHEMQRHRMSIGIFYQQLLLELLKNRWPNSSVGGHGESDLIAEIETPGFDRGLQLYMSVKKSADTVGGQDVGGAISKLEQLAKADKNLNRPYLCVIAIATPSSGKVLSFDEDRKVKGNIRGQPYSVNCEYWGPGFLFPYVCGRSPIDVYRLAYSRVADYLPFRTLQYRAECSRLLRNHLSNLGLVNDDETINAQAFLQFVTGEQIG